MGLSNKLSCEAGSFSHHHNPHRFLQPEVSRLYFPALKPLVALCVSLPVVLPVICMQMWDCPVHQPPPCPPHQPPPCHRSFPPQPVSTSPTSLNECFFFNSLVVGLPYSSIFWQFWLFFVFTFVVILLLIVQGGKVYLPTPPSWPEVSQVHSFLALLITCAKLRAKVQTLVLKIQKLLFAPNVFRKI